MKTPDEESKGTTFQQKALNKIDGIEEIDFRKIKISRSWLLIRSREQEHQGSVRCIPDL